MKDKNARVERKIPQIPVYSSVTDNKEEVLRYLIRAGIQAPSWYNSQPWEIKAKDNCIKVYLNPDVDKTILNWKNVNSMMACGAALENIFLAAEARGLSPKVSMLPELCDPLLMGQVELNFFEKSDDSEDELAGYESSIWLRYTNTLLYKKDKLAQSVAKQLGDVVESFEGANLYFITSEVDKHKLWKAASMSECIRFSRRDLHQQLYNMIRWSEQEVEADKTGCSLPALGVCGIGDKYFRMTRSWNVMRTLNLIGGAKNQAQRSCNGFLNCSAIGILTLNNDDLISVLQAGRGLQRLWLKVTQLGFDLQPHNAMLMFEWAVNHQGKKAFSQAEIRMQKNAMELLRKVFSSEGMKKDETGVFLFRLGKAGQINGYTLRKDIL